MSNEYASLVSEMSFKKNPRDGQGRVFLKVFEDASCRSLNIQLPTGYGKSFVSAGVYKILQKKNRANRLLVIVPTVSQRTQMVQDGPSDFIDANISGPPSVIDIGFFGTEAVGRHRENKNQIFTITSQALANGAGELVREMMKSGQWMVTVDEYHHYGIEKSWGQAATALPYSFLLAMSATPFRKEDDSAFGAPDIVVSYRDAWEEGAVKELRGHSYVYRVDLLKEGGDVVSMTTSDLIEEAGTDTPGGIENHIIKKNMRWLPKYISPLVVNPIARMLKDRIETGYPLQAIAGAMCVEHAKIVCSQINSMFPRLRVDWVGTGKSGRNDKDNRDIINKFCPQKNDHGIREHSLDILVHVGMAGEGLDSTYVSEVIHLNKANMNNSNNQENGRAARFLPGVVGNINFESCCEYSEYLGHKMMDAMDFLPPSQEEDDDKEPRDPNEISPLPDMPKINIWNVELERIESGSEEVKNMAHFLATEVGPKEYGVESLQSDINNPESELYKMAETYCNNLKMNNAKKHNEQAVVAQWQEAVKDAVSVVVSRVVRLATAAGLRVDKTVITDICRRVNTRKKFEIGEVKKDVKCLESHYAWLKGLENHIIKTKSIPGWLM